MENQRSLKVMHVIAHKNVGGPAVLVADLMHSVDAPRISPQFWMYQLYLRHDLQVLLCTDWSHFQMAALILIMRFSTQARWIVLESPVQIIMISSGIKGTLKRE